MSDVLGLVEKQLSSNMQGSMRSGGHSLENQVGCLLAQYFYYFLSGRINRLPDFSVIDKIIEKRTDASQNSFLLSEGYGMLIRLDQGELDIEYDEPITDKSIRRDAITRKFYGARIIYEYNRDSERINVNDLPAFDIKRIKYLQQYLQQYHEYYESKTNEHHKK